MTRILRYNPLPDCKDPLQTSGNEKRIKLSEHMTRRGKRRNGICGREIGRRILRTALQHLSQDRDDLGKIAINIREETRPERMRFGNGVVLPVGEDKDDFHVVE